MSGNSQTRRRLARLQVWFLLSLKWRWALGCGVQHPHHASSKICQYSFVAFYSLAIKQKLFSWYLLGDKVWEITFQSLLQHCENVLRWYNSCITWAEHIVSELPALSSMVQRVCYQKCGLIFWVILYTLQGKCSRWSCSGLHEHICLFQKPLHLLLVKHHQWQKLPWLPWEQDWVSNAMLQ